MLNFYQEDKWRVSVQEEDGLNNHYYIFPKNKQLFWQLAQSNGGIILRFIGKYAQQLPVEEHSIFVSNIPHKSDVATFIRTSTYCKRDKKAGYLGAIFPGTNRPRTQTPKY